MKKFPYKTLSFFILMAAFLGEASADCCSGHGGTSGCDSATGQYRCADGTLSNCACTSNSSYNNEQFDEYDGAYHEHHGHHFHHHDHHHDDHHGHHGHGGHRR